MALHPPARQPGAAPQTPARPPQRPAPRPAAAAGTGLNHSKLVQLLAEWTANGHPDTPALPSALTARAAPQAGASTPLAERLGRWLGVHEAIGLSGALKQVARLPAPSSPPANPAAAPHHARHQLATGEPNAAGAPVAPTAPTAPTAPVATNAATPNQPSTEAPNPATAAWQHLQQARRAVLDLVQQPEPSGRSRRGRPGAAFQPAALPSQAAEDLTRFAPHLRAYRQRQQSLADAVAPLRQQARQALADSGPAGARLAALDSALADAVQAREHSLLASVPLLMERRFDQLREAAEAAACSNGVAEAAVHTPAAPARTPPSSTSAATRALMARQAAQPAWLQQFAQDANALLLAEAELRLTPVDGLLAALLPPAPPAP